MHKFSATSQYKYNLLISGQGRLIHSLHLPKLIQVLGITFTIDLHKALNMCDDNSLLMLKECVHFKTNDDNHVFTIGLGKLGNLSGITFRNNVAYRVHTNGDWQMLLYEDLVFPMEPVSSTSGHVLCAKYKDVSNVSVFHSLVDT